MYRVFRKEAKRTTKILHGLLHVFAFIIALVGEFLSTAFPSLPALQTPAQLLDTHCPAPSCLALPYSSPHRHRRQGHWVLAIIWLDHSPEVLASVFPQVSPPLSMTSRVLTWPLLCSRLGGRVRLSQEEGLC